MPGAQPRKQLIARLGSAVARGAYSPPGVPGVYPVRRMHVRNLESAWITPPPVTVTGFMNGYLLNSVGVRVFTEANVPVTEASAYAGTTQGPPGGGTGGVATMLAAQGRYAPSTNQRYEAVINLAFIGINMSEMLYQGQIWSGIPGGAELHPDDTYILVSSSVIGDLLFAVSDGAEPVTVTGALRLVDPALFPGFGISLPWLTPSMVSSQTTVVESASLTDVGPSDAPEAQHHFEIPLTFGGTYNTAIYFASIEGYNPTGAVWPYRVHHFLHMLDLSTGLGPRWSAVVQPPRYRIP